MSDARSLSPKPNRRPRAVRSADLIDQRRQWIDLADFSYDESVVPRDCCECGACCFSDSDTYVEVLKEDYVRLGSRAEEVTAVVDGKRYLRMADGRCAQLEHADGAWVCSIYRIRPEACRLLARGSGPCLAERAVKRVRALRASKRLLVLARTSGKTNGSLP